MANSFRRAFFAFPAQPNDLFTTIGSACERVKELSDKIELKPWPQMDIFGAGLADVVRKEIRDADLLVCDITMFTMKLGMQSDWVSRLRRSYILLTLMLRAALRPMDFLMESAINLMTTVTSLREYLSNFPIISFSNFTPSQSTNRSRCSF
jgi:hypothetical protein